MGPRALSNLFCTSNSCKVSVRLLAEEEWFILVRWKGKVNSPLPPVSTFNTNLQSLKVSKKYTLQYVSHLLCLIKGGERYGNSSTLLIWNDLENHKLAKSTLKWKLFFMVITVFSPLVGDGGLHLIKGKSSMHEQVVGLVIISLFH